MSNKDLLNMSSYPLALQLLMQTDGTVTELIKLLAKEAIVVNKIKEEITPDNILSRHIFLKGISTKVNWLYAESQIYLDVLPKEFVNDLLRKNLPIGSLWINYKMETFKQLLSQKIEVTSTDKQFKVGSILLVRVYQVFSNKRLIMQIKEKFPIKAYQNISL